MVVDYIGIEQTAIEHVKPCPQARRCAGAQRAPDRRGEKAALADGKPNPQSPTPNSQEERKASAPKAD
jgi:hypothetical protein